MNNSDLEIGIVQQVMNFLGINESIDNFQLYEKLLLFRNQMHPDHHYDDDSKKIAHEKFVKAGQLLTDLNSFINREKLSKPADQLVLSSKDFQIINTQQSVINREKEIEILNQKISKLRKIVKDLLAQNKNLAKDKKEANYDELKNLYRSNGKIKVGIGLKLAFALVYSFVTTIDQVAIAMQKFIPLSPNLVNNIIFFLILLSIFHNIWNLVRNAIVEKNAERIETTILISKFSQILEENHNGSKISEIKIYDFMKKEFTSEKKFRLFWEKLFAVNDDVIIEKYKNIFINSLLEKQLIRISKARGLDREFYVFGTSWSERMNDRTEITKELIDDDDIDSLFDDI